MAEAANTNRLTQLLLVAGAAIGLGAALWSALGVNEAISKYGDAIAIVDGVPIPRAVFDAAVEGLAAAKRNPLTDAEKREALDRIVDEELLLRRSMELGLPESDPTARKALVNAMLQFSIAESSKLEPTDEELRRFYAERPKLIAPQPLLTVKAVSFDNTDAAGISAMKAAIDAGGDFDAAARTAKGKPVLLPGGPAIPSKLAEYAGGTVRDAALSLSKGENAGPVEIGRRIVFLHLVERTEAPPPPLEEVRDVVVEEWRNRTTEKAFEDYLTSLWARARVSYAPDAPKADAK